MAVDPVTQTAASDKQAGGSYSVATLGKGWFTSMRDRAGSTRCQQALDASFKGSQEDIPGTHVQEGAAW